MMMDSTNVMLAGSLIKLSGTVGNFHIGIWPGSVSVNGFDNLEILEIDP